MDATSPTATAARCKRGQRVTAPLMIIIIDISFNFMINIAVYGAIKPARKVLGRAARAARAALIAAALAAPASGQATSAALKIRTIAEVEAPALEAGRKGVRLVPADRVVPGDQVMYTLEVRNTGLTPVTAPTVVNAIPEHMVYVADSATGPGAKVTYSADGGHTFDRPENLRVRGVDGSLRTAKPMDYTHIRWQLKNVLKSHSIAFARFRAVVK